MERRKFMIGAGSTAIGASAIVGSGAFSSARVDRDIDVGVVSDNVAYLGLVSEGPYAGYDDGKLQLDFSALNKGSDTQFGDVFKIVNNGTNTVRVSMSDTEDTIEWKSEGLTLFHSDESHENGSFGAWKAFQSPDLPNPDGRPREFLDIESGKEAYIHVGIFLRDQNVSASDIPDKIGIYAQD